MTSPCCIRSGTSSRRRNRTDRSDDRAAAIVIVFVFRSAICRATRRLHALSERWPMHSHSLDQWTHDHMFLGAQHGRNERRTWFVVALTAVMMVFEILAGTLF